MANIKLSLLDKTEVYGSHQLDVIKKYGTVAFNTDLAFVTGLLHNYDGILISKKGQYWTKSLYEDEFVYHVNEYGVIDWSDCRVESLSIRPVLRLSTEKFNEIKTMSSVCENGVYEVNFGEYPQDAPDASTQIILEFIFLENRLTKTGKSYNFGDSLYEEYEYDRKKYVRKKSINGDYLWIEVSPVTWLVDDKQQILISKRCLLSGIRFHDNNYKIKKYRYPFKHTEIYRFLNEFMVNDLFRNDSLINNNILLSEDDVSIFEGFINDISPLDREAYINALKDLKSDIILKNKYKR